MDDLARRFEPTAFCRLSANLAPDVGQVPSPGPVNSHRHHVVMVGL